ncbi:prepilin-type N-terminal cleavage/methylation domain-containing protein [Campylobacter canadensis]|uniref:prepilin-type N-terminal cleavage/methylation domain-containing protein n=1 Tax=Campylobacter canadensis TaxID=449520 RepID=UPI00155801F5|nr:prepilin-type N-terminal cleavage/methylation domain-containing protein [Campylobacter canadensis]MBZ7994044.1 prepilin-type N-terminal cleavage/methylation domain-containing protein [Campylobacter canadensis]MBZ7995953.1 prepilin-type N-terminal cleavage/methylation domain-containing protein [Campylobacter canadensis]MBZ7999375.1 prepilin-type N-terminal cleavage/methylation domain-containing protein [Campylobacter canadensis]MBZ8001172.1 prepilin-type N-terminal cleavage/methylation domain
MFYRKRTFSSVRMDVKRAFTLLELVVVVVLVAILSSVAVSKIHTGSKLDEYVYNLLNDIRYTQILALSYDAYNGSTNFDQIKNSYYLNFGTNCYSIFFNKSTQEIINDYMGSNSKLECKQGSRTYLDGLAITGNPIGFDYLGRPIISDGIANTPSEITLKYNSEEKIITIQPYTGYLSVK